MPWIIDWIKDMLGMTDTPPIRRQQTAGAQSVLFVQPTHKPTLDPRPTGLCLLYTSPSPRD